MKTYHGKPCKHCGNTERRKDNYNCILCTRRYNKLRNKKIKAEKAEAARIITEEQAKKDAELVALKAEENRKVAEELNKIIYIGAMCSKHLTQKRYKSNFKCVECLREGSANQVARVKSEHKTSEEKWAELKPRFRDVKTNDEFKGRSYRV